MQEIKKVRERLNTMITVPLKERTRFFKVGVGDYAEHDQFMGITVPNLRKIAKDFLHLNFDDLQILISSPFNEERLFALFILITQYKKAPPQQQDIFYQFYMRNLQHINNWNIVDASAHVILGDYLLTRNRTILKTLAYSDVMWERRVAIVSTWQFIKNGDLYWTFDLVQILFKDPHDLMHKATGWMLREAGKLNQEMLVTFLNDHYKNMPRTMVRYAIEKLPKESWSLYR